MLLVQVIEMQRSVEATELNVANKLFLKVEFRGFEDPNYLHVTN